MFEKNRPFATSIYEWMRIKIGLQRKKFTSVTGGGQRYMVMAKRQNASNAFTFLRHRL